jgi:hypothetical protein
MFIAVNMAAHICRVRLVIRLSKTMIEKTYKAEKVRHIVPPEVGLGQDAREKPQSHGDDGDGNEDGIDGNQGSISLDRQAAHVGRHIFGHWL